MNRVDAPFIPRSASIHPLIIPPMGTTIFVGAVIVGFIYALVFFLDTRNKDK